MRTPEQERDWRLWRFEMALREAGVRPHRLSRRAELMLGVCQQAMAIGAGLVRGRI